MKFLRIALPLTLGLLASPVFCNKALACSCVPKGSPCEAYGSASAVFIGSVLSYEDRSDYRIYIIKREETFLGNLALTLKASSSDGGCGYEFQTNKRYLIYVHREHFREGNEEIKEFYATYCSRTQPLEEAEEDLRFLRIERREISGIRVYGMVAKDNSWDPRLPKAKWVQPIPHIQVRVEGQGKSYDLLTDENGRYEIVGIPPGAYEISLLLPSGIRTIGSGKDLIYINEHGCSKGHFWIVNKNE